MKKNNTSKKIKFVVDLTNVNDCDEVKLAFIRAKVFGGVKITKDEFDFIVAFGAKMALRAIDVMLERYIGKASTQATPETPNKSEKKTPWYKRFWNWIKKPFVKK